MIIASLFTALKTSSPKMHSFNFRRHFTLSFHNNCPTCLCLLYVHLFVCTVCFHFMLRFLFSICRYHLFSCNLRLYLLCLKTGPTYMKLEKNFAPSYRQDPSPITMTDDRKLWYRKEEGEVRLMSNIVKKLYPNPLDMFFFFHSSMTLFFFI